MTELLWDGKYKDGKKQGPVRIALPFQTIETVNEGTEARLRSLELFASGRETGWRNRLIWGDKKYVLPSLLPEFAGKVNLIYIDPPFDTGADFSFTATIPQHSNSDEDETTSFTKEPSILEQKAYRDTWGRGLDSYLQWFYETVVLLRELLAEDGSIYVHTDWHVNAAARLVLEEVFGRDWLDTEIIWKRKDAQSFVDTYGMLHDTIYFVRKGKDFTFNKQYVPLSQDTADTWYTNEEAVKTDTTNSKGQLIPAGTVRRYNKADITAPGLRLGTEAHYQWKGQWPPPGRHWAYRKEIMQKLESAGRVVYSKSGRAYEKRYLDESAGVPAQSIWTDVSFVRGMSKHKADSEWLDYPTQKPEALLQRIIQASSNEGDLVLDCFVGSGTTAAVAEKLNRRWIACDLSRFAIHTTRKRLLGIPGVKPFVVQNLGKYERQAWQVAEFPANGENKLEEQRQREAAYRKFILELYHAAPITGRTWLHGIKGGRMVHVGAVDAPVTLADVKAIARETWKAVASGKDAPAEAGVDILGWDFAFELNETAKQVAAESHVRVAFKKIPREVLDKRAVEQGDVQFFELGALSVDMKQKGREVTLKLTDFTIPTDDIPEEARKAVKHWSQLVDYWAVDWDYRNDTFHNQWQSYRTRKDPKIELEAKHTYPEAGRYTVVVKVIDILGNDTTKTVEVEVR
ncbi:MAG TPA: DNA methyltransferase [Terriglobia bacterium]|nr:DNA methyltransferase [Terriglobia bacterium]